MISEIVLVNEVMVPRQQGSDAWAGLSNTVQQILSFPQSREFIHILGFINRI